MVPHILACASDNLRHFEIPQIWEWAGLFNSSKETKGLALQNDRMVRIWGQEVGYIIV